MGLFGSSNRIQRQSDLKLTLGNIIILMLMTLIIFQAVGLVFSGSWGASIKLGPIFILMSVLFSSSISVAIFKKLMNNQEVSKKDIFAIMITAVIAILMLVYLEEFVPEIFSQGLVALQSMIGF